MIKLVKEYQLEIASVPFEPEDGKVYFISSGVNPTADHFVEDNYEELREMFAQESLDFVYVPQHVSKDLNGRDVPPTVLSYAASKETEQGRAFSAYQIDLNKEELGEAVLYQLYEVANAYSRRGSLDGAHYNLGPQELQMVEQMAFIARELRRRGVRMSDLGPVFGIWMEPRQLEIDSRGRLIFPNYDNVKLALDPLEKATYIFLLQHPEGIEPDAFVGHRKELLRIYRHFTIFTRDDLIESTIDNLLSEDKQTLYTTISRLNKKIEKKLQVPFAKPYKIVFRQRPVPGRYYIDVPFDNIRWEQRF